MKKENYFKKEIEYVEDTKKREDLVYLINLLPDYFFEIPASSTNKYHPDYASTNAGLVKHVKVVTRIAYELLNNPIYRERFTDSERDLIIMACVLHDGFKSGCEKERYTRFDHPLIMSEVIMENRNNLSLTTDEVRGLCKMIEAHMGPWNTNSYSDIVLPKPENERERFVHLCDYLASRKFLNVNFNGIEIKG